MKLKIPTYLMLFMSLLALEAAADSTRGTRREPYSFSFAAGGYDPQGHFMGGTELLNLIPYNGRLYAGVGYWMDKPDFFPHHPDPASGPQVLVLDGRDSQWRQEVVFPQTNSDGSLTYQRPAAMGVAEFHMTGNGRMLRDPVQILLIGLDGGGTGGAVYTQTQPGHWENTHFPGTTLLRSFGVHVDPVSGVEKLYAGAGTGEVGKPGALYSAVYDPQIPGRLRWNPAVEFDGSKNRTMSMTVCDQELFFSGKPSIFGQDKVTGQWSSVYNYPMTVPFNKSKYTSGFRGLTCIQDPTHPATHSLLTAFEGSPGDVMRIDLHTGLATFELHIKDFLSNLWGADLPAAKKDFLAAYNDMPLINTRSGEVRVLGLLVHNQSPAHLNSAWFLTRPENAGVAPSYALHEVPALPFPNRRSDDALFSVRTVVVSPFPEDQGKVLYMGGYDGHFKTDHNTAWMYRVGIETAVGP